MMPASKPDYTGLMSGTGIDAALVDFSAAQPELINTHNHRWPDALQQAQIRWWYSVKKTLAAAMS